jgi:hypothetical protein
MVYGIVISLVLALVSLAPQAWAATYTANSCQNTATTPDVQSAINRATNSGDIVVVPAGNNCSWTTAVVLPMDHDITLMGSGDIATGVSCGTDTNGTPIAGTCGAATSGGTTITVNSSNPYLCAFEVPTGHQVVTNLTFDIPKGAAIPNDAANPILCIGARNNGLGNTTLSDPMVIMHHISIRQHDNRGGHWLSVTGWPRALIYRIDVRNDVTWTPGPGGINNNGPQLLIVARDPSISWLTASTYGAADTNGNLSVYVETSNFVNDAVAFDISAGAWAVIRNNTFTDASISDHGNDGAMGDRKFEINDNIFKCVNQWAVAGWYASRGGTGVIADNIAPGAAQCWTGVGRWNSFVRILRTGFEGYIAKATTGTLTAGSPVITNMGSTTGFLAANQGCPGCPAQPLYSGTFNGPYSGQSPADNKIPFGALVQSVDSPTQITMTMNANVSGPTTIMAADCYPGPYPWPHQPGWGKDSGALFTNEVIEPIYIWNNKATVGGTAGEADTYSTLDRSGMGCSFDNSSQTSANYIQQNREYYLGIAKPGYVKFTYPHPLATVTGAGAVAAPASTTAPAPTTAPAAPTGLIVR